MKRYLQCAEQQESASNFSKYCACQEKWLSWSILFTHETLFTMRGGTSVIVQTHQILRLPRKMNLMIDPCHIWNAIYNARSNTCHCPNSPNTAPATQIDSGNFPNNFSKTAEMSFPLRGRSEQDPTMIRAWSEHEPRNRGYFSRPPRAFCIEKYNISRSGYHSKCHRILRLPRKVTLPPHRILRLPRKMTLQLHQILRLPREMTLMINPQHTWNAIYNARNNRWHPPTSPNTAPATPNDSPKFQKHFSKTDETSITMRDRSETVPRMIRAWSENDPSMKPSLRNPPRNRGYFPCPPRAFCIEKYNISRSGYHSKFHRILRLPRKMTLQLHQILRLPRKMTRIIDPHDMSHVIYNVQRNSTHPPTSLNTAPATQNETHDWSAWHMKRYLQCAEQQVAPPTSPNTAPATQNDSSHMKRYLQCAEQQVASSNITKYCACHAKWFSKISETLTDETSITMRDRSELDPSWIREWNRHSATRLATEVTFHAQHEHFVLKNTTFRAPAIIPNFTEYCACHEKWHFNFTKYCACHAKWLASLILMTCHTSFTMRSATALTLRPH